MISFWHTSLAVYMHICLNMTNSWYKWQFFIFLDHKTFHLIWLWNPVTTVPEKYKKQECKPKTFIRLVQIPSVVCTCRLGRWGFRPHLLTRNHTHDQRVPPRVNWSLSVWPVFHQWHLETGTQTTPIHRGSRPIVEAESKQVQSVIYFKKKYRS